MSALDMLLRRRSVLARNLGEPGPSDDELWQILAAGARVPDHGKLGPWRFIIIRGAARESLGNVLVAATKRMEPEASENRLTLEAQRFLRVPVTIAVVSRVQVCKIPEWEQVLSSGAACQNLLNATHALGYHGQWLTEWYAYDPLVLRALGLGDGERIAGFVYIGTAQIAPEERQRPRLDDIVSELNDDPAGAVEQHPPPTEI